MAVERLDKLICKSGKFSRSEIKKLAKFGAVCVDGVVVKDLSEKADGDTSEITVSGELIDTKDKVYYMMNKPKGVVSASEGRGDVTVVDILPDELKRNGLFPAGRLDKDTTGFVLITDDGEFAHRILSPKNHINKTYIAVLDKPLNDASKIVLEQGIELKDGTKFRPSEINFIDDTSQLIEITICEGKYHQIKRMFKAVGCTVMELKRIKMGNLLLDSSLDYGEVRPLTQKELELVENN